MAWAESDLDTVRAAIASGVQEVTYQDGRKIRYQSLDHLVAAEKVIATALTMQARATSGIISRRVPYYRSGL